MLQNGYFVFTSWSVLWSPTRITYGLYEVHMSNQTEGASHPREKVWPLHLAYLGKNVNFLFIVSDTPNPIWDNRSYLVLAQPKIN